MLRLVVEPVAGGRCAVLQPHDDAGGNGVPPGLELNASATPAILVFLSALRRDVSAAAGGPSSYLPTVSPSPTEPSRTGGVASGRRRPRSVALRLAEAMG